MRDSVTAQWRNVQTSSFATNWGKLQLRRLKRWRSVRDGSLEKKMCLRMVQTLSRREETTVDESRSGWPSTRRSPEMIEKVRQILAQDRRLSKNSLRRNWALERTHRSPSTAMIWVSGRSDPDLCRRSSQTSRKQNG